MCVVSMVGDSFTRDWKERYPEFIPPAPTKEVPVQTLPYITPPAVTRAEFEALKREMELLKRLLIEAKEYDRRNNEPHCDNDEKTALLRAIAKHVGVDLSEVFPE